MFQRQVDKITADIVDLKIFGENGLFRKLRFSDGSLIAAGIAIGDGKGFPKEAAMFAEQAAAHWSPHPVFVMDVGSTFLRILADF